MKVKVLKDYIDKHTRILHSAGTELIMTDERFEEIRKSGRYVEKIDEGENDEQSHDMPESSREESGPGLTEELAVDKQPEQEKAKKTRRGGNKKQGD